MPVDWDLHDTEESHFGEGDNYDDTSFTQDNAFDDDLPDPQEHANMAEEWDPDTSSNSIPSIPSHRHRVYHSNKCQTLPGGRNLLQRMDEDGFAEIRNSENLFFPFASKSEWEVADWLSSGSLSQKEIDAYLHLERNKINPLSFQTAKDLHTRIESLPDVPHWHFQEIKVGQYRTKQPLTLYWRDGLKVVKHLFGNPLFASCMDFDPYREFEETPHGQEPVYGEFMSSDCAWEIQSGLPSGHSFVGVIGASDKTPLTRMSGDKEMHPLLLSLANIHACVRMKATSHAFALVAYLPIPKFLNVSPAVQSVLSARVYHFAVSIVMQNLKMAECCGEVMSDPSGNLRVVHTPLVVWIADYPEQLMIAGISSKNSPISTAVAEQFGDSEPSPPRLRQRTLNAIQTACDTCDPCDIAAFHKVCLTLRLNGVVAPFWADWGDACPSSFLTPDALHQWHKFFFDHCVQWVINIIGATELDRRLSVLQPRTGTRRWPNGVSTAKQTGGKEHRDLERLLAAISAGAVHRNVLRALRAITEFIFLAQRVYHDNETLHSLAEALREFHHYKQSIIEAGGRQGKNGPLNHFRIPKLELAQHVARSTRALGAPYQWTSDITERCHITHVKIPYHLSNHRNFHGQCCRFLDRQEKQRLFHLYTSLKMTRTALIDEVAYEEQLIQESSWSHVPHSIPVSASSAGKSLFENPRSRISADAKRALLITVHPHFPNLSVDDAARLFRVDDLRPALGDFFSGRSYTSRNGRRLAASSNCPLPFISLRGWDKFRIQLRSVQNPLTFSPPQTVQAEPPSPSLPFGRANTVLVAHESGDLISSDVNSERYLIAQVRAILEPITDPPSSPLLYVEFFNFSNAYFAVVDGIRIAAPAPDLEVFLVRRRLRSDGQHLGDIVCFDDVRQVVQLIPKFGSVVSPDMTCNNSLELSMEFYVNSFADKETFHAILSIQ